MEEEKLSGAALGARLVELYGNEKAVESFKKKLTFGDFASKDENRLFMTGVFYEEGFAVATDGRVLLKQKADYPKEWEGKVISLSNGKEIEGVEFPKYKRLLDFEGSVPRQEIVDDMDKFLASSVAVVKSKLDANHGSCHFPVAFGDGQAVDPQFFSVALGWASEHGFNECRQSVQIRPKLNDDFQEVKDENGKTVMEERFGALRFSSPDGSEMLVMPLAKDAATKNVSITVDGTLHNIESGSVSVESLQAAAMGQGKELYKGIAEILLSRHNVHPANIEKVFSEKFSKAKAKGKETGFPETNDDCLALAAAWTVAEGLGESLGDNGFAFAPGQSVATLEGFVASMYFEKVKSLGKRPSLLFRGVELSERSMLDEAKSAGLLKEAQVSPGAGLLPGFTEANEDLASEKVPLNGILNAMELMCSATADGKYKLYDWGNGKFILGKDGAETFDDARGLLEAAERNLDDFYGRKLRAALVEAKASVPDGAGLKELCSIYQEYAKDATYGLDAESFFFNNALAAANPELCEMPEYEATVKIKGEVWKVRDVEEGIKRDVERLFKEWDSGDKERNLVLNGVRLYGDLESNLENDGDVKVLVEFDSKNPERRWREDSVFNALAEEGLEIGGVKIDFNPITPEKSGTISEYLARLEELGAKTEAQAIKKLDGMIRKKEDAAHPPTEMKPAAGKKERRAGYKGLRFFDRNYSEADEFLKYFNSVKRPGAPDMTASDAEAVLRALDHFNVGVLRGRSERLALNESDELVFVTRDEAGLAVEKTSPQGVITRAAEKAVRERDQMRASVGRDAGIEALKKFAASILKSYEDQADELSEIKERLVGSAEGMELKAGQTLAGKEVSDAFQIGSGVWQADFGKPSAKDARLVLTKSAVECVPESLRGCFSQDGEYFVMENKFADPYVYKALVESGRVMPRDENYMEMLSAHVKKYPAKYLPLYPVTKESFGDCMRKLSKIDGTTDPLELSNKLLKLVMPSKVTELHKWIGKMSEVSPGVRSEARLKSFLSEMLAGAERKREKARAGGYPPRGE